MRDHIEAWLIAFELCFFCAFYGMANYGHGYDAPVYFKDKFWYIGEAFVIFGLHYFAAIVSKNINYRTTWRILATFFLIRAIWEVSAMIQGIASWERLAMAIMFWGITTVIFIITFLPFIKHFIRQLWQKRRWQ